MKSKASKTSTRTNQQNKNQKKLPSKNPSKKTSKLNKDAMSKASKNLSKKSKKLLSVGEQEIDAQSLPSNKSQMSDLNILSKNSDMTRIKTYEIVSDEKITFLLSFEQVKEKIKISVVEKDSFPQNKYENFYSLEDFIKINKWFNIFYNIESLLVEFEQLTKNEFFAIEQKNKDVLSLFIIFPIDLLDRIEIQLPINEINSLDLFSQLISKISEIETKENNEIALFDEKIENLGHLLQSIEEANKAREEELLQKQQNEAKDEEQINKENNEEEQNEENKSNENKSNKSDNLEQMKDALKLQIEKKIKNDNNQKNEDNNKAILKETENNEEEIEEKNKESNKESNKELLIHLDINSLPFADSTIITSSDPQRTKELNLLISWLGKDINPNAQSQIHFSTKLLFSSEKEDDKASSFHKKCDNIAPTLTLIETKEGFRYGGFTTQFWESTEQSIFKKDKNAFIFSLDTEKKYDVTDEEKSIQCSMYWGPYFGEGGAICVPDNFLEEKNAFYQWPSSYDISEKDELTFGQEHNINISKYEVFEIIIRNEENGDINEENNEGDINEENNEGDNNEGDNIEMENEQGELHELEPRKDNED